MTQRLGNNRLEDGSVTGNKITDGAVNSNNIVDGAITTNKLVDQAVDAVKIKLGVINTQHFVSGSVKGNVIGVNAISSNNIVDGAITAEKIAPGAGGNPAAFDTANASFIRANTALLQANASFVHANAAFAAANSAGGADQFARNTANSAFARANNSINANTGGIITGPLTVSRLTSNTIGGINSPSSRFSLSTANQSVIHISSNTNGASTTNTQQYGITFSPAGNSTQAGIIISENNSDGTSIGFFCTNSYAAGPQLRSFISPDGHFTPGTSASFDLGTSSLRWRNVFTSDLHLNNGIGNYTIVEGEDDLFLYNNRTGKTFKFVLQEVDSSIVPKKMRVD